MLCSLHIQDYALIDKLDIDFEKGFSVISGETGAGKSIILGALGLLLGQRADMKSIRKGAQKCVVEATFDVRAYQLQEFFKENDFDYDDECVLRREVYASGKSRAFINDTPVQLAQMKALGDLLVDIHSQHQNLLLNKESFQLNVVDVIAQDVKQLSSYRSLFHEWKDEEKKLKQALAQLERAKSDEDYIRYQYNLLDEADLRDGEQEELEKLSEVLSHAEEIKGGLYEAEQLLSSDERGLLTALKQCQHALQGLTRVYPDARELAERVESTYIELKDISQEVSDQQETVEFSPERLEEVNSRLNEIYTLQQKYKVTTVAELMTLKEEYRQKLSMIDSSDEHIAELQERCKHLHGQVCTLAEALTDVRTKAAKKIEKQMMQSLVLLGMPHVNFKVELGQREEPDVTGRDIISFLFSANKNAPLQDISSVASGGEIARVMLSLKAMIAQAVSLPTIIFDEIDTGVSGEIADRMAHIMREMGENNRQVISITHLPQIASKGRHHYKVYKTDTVEGTNTHIRLLSVDERIEEIARMLSGATLTDAAMNNARELLSQS